MSHQIIKTIDKYMINPMLRHMVPHRHSPCDNVISLAIGICLGLLVSTPLILRACEQPENQEIQIPAIEPITIQELVLEQTETQAETAKSTPIPETITDTAITEQEPVKKEPAIQQTTQTIILSDSDREYLAKCTEAEASGEGFLGKCLVIDVILNRVDSSLFPGKTVTDVILQHNDATGVWQFSVAGNGMLENATPTQETYDAIDHELQCRSYPGLLYFTSEGFSPYGTPWQKIGNHYFSTAK